MSTVREAAVRDGRRSLWSSLKCFDVGGCLSEVDSIAWTKSVSMSNKD